MSKKTFGKLPSGERLMRITKSPQYKDGAFQNIEVTPVILQNVSIFKMLKDYFNKPKTVIPSKEIPYVKTDLHNLKFNSPTIIWFGHSSYLIHSMGINILIDPVFSGNASPIKYFGKSFLGSDNYNAEDFPIIDILIITHDHYDHLDYKTIPKIHKKVKKVITALGVGEHLEFWGVEKNKIIELDWWDTQLIDPNIEINATPARHFSGRGVKRGKTLWTSFALKIHGYKIFIGGDSGYDKQFQLIGNKFNGFDLALLESGQYGESWPYIHMTPDQTVNAARDLNAEILFPVHWGKFALANHPWNEPIQRLIVAAQKGDQKVVVPMIGQPYAVGEKYQQTNWWNFD